ncbi:MAG: hypothetical protein COB67_07310 [SAR324 cluster bacterium]|uniref:Glycoside hydrolase family 57 N-terminal domain-containing protein n=1 Tax=SAR324 cluster bacterium TaxID=2024889 RepID=A0A2A4T3C3_9DELT|nr:MAG: hypothetical protein COB67_07310 [SAR324 cluster bacterium]
MKKSFQGAGLELLQQSGPYVELYFHWDQLPQLQLQEEYYLVEVIPNSPYLPKQYAKPNSSGPLHFRLEEGIDYQFNLLRTAYLKYQVTSNLIPLPSVDLIKEHEDYHKLVWGNIDWKQLCETKNSEWLSIQIEDEDPHIQAIESAPEYSFHSSPTEISVYDQNQTHIFTITTNLSQRSIVSSLDVSIDPAHPVLFLSTAIKPEISWRIRAELPASFQIQQHWTQQFLEQFPNSNPNDLIGEFHFYEEQQLNSRFRIWGYNCKINPLIIPKIQLEEWKEGQIQPIQQIRLELQITSPHRELYHKILTEKLFSVEQSGELLAFTSHELEVARKELFNVNPQVSWDQSHIELVLWFKTEKYDWQEFQREIAHSLRWDFHPQEKTNQCTVKFHLYDSRHSERQLTYLESGFVNRDHWKNQVQLKPYSSQHLLAWWDLEPLGVEHFLQEQWDATLGSVGFYLKVHEEFLGERTHRLDLTCPLVDLFSAHQSIYFKVDPDKTYSAEIVVRFQDQEVALTPISRSIVAPKTDNEIKSRNQYKRLNSTWYHSSQREVRHQQGQDHNNQAKVLLHLHMHSPNLSRVDPFRESFLKSNTWPIETEHGHQVHNTPGEWIFKNCLDSWLPLLRVFRNLVQQGVDYQISLDISPTVAYSLNSPRFKDYFSRYLLRFQAFTQSQIALMKAQLDSPELIWAAEQYLINLIEIDQFYNHELGKDIIAAYRSLELSGHLELSTCTATHGMPANLESTPDSLNAQISLAAKSHHRIFGDHPRGIWLAENSCFPSVEQYLSEKSLNYFFVEAEAILRGSFQPQEEEFNPVILPQSEVIAFGRSRMGRVQVWDADVGYAGHQDFREYHHRHRGLPLKRITSKSSDHKEAYNPEQASIIAQELGRDFYQKLCTQAETLSARDFQSIPLITCSYDAELFGHHWWEGPLFLEELLREFHRKGDQIGLTTPSHYLANHPSLPEVMPNPSTWGHDAVHVRWTDPKVSWVQRELGRADHLLREYLRLALQGQLTGFQKKLIEQMAAELIRAQSSDLTFVIISGDFEEDMEREIQKFLDYFYRLKYLVDNNIKQRNFLEFRQYENDMFPEIHDYYQISKML